MICRYDFECFITFLLAVIQVSTLAVSPSGTLIASGQVGTKNFKGNAAPIFLWHAASCRRLLVLRGLSGSATYCAFSTDERFMCGADEVSC